MRPRTRSLFSASLLVPPLAALLAAAPAARADVTVAFVGDMTANPGARAVVELIGDRDVDLFVALGDLGYYPEGAVGAERWTSMVDEVLGEDFPVLLVVGNHEDLDWHLYARWQRERLAALPELDCDGETGVKALCTFRGVSIVQAAPGIGEVDGVAPEDGYPEFIGTSLADDANPWRICAWHKNQRAMQIGAKGDETGWEVYQACLRSGAIVATAHEHTYSRTFLMDDFETQSVAHRNDHLEIAPGRSFAFVSGLGGHSVRAQQSDGHWWASRYSSDQGASYGALFCTFGDAEASCRFEDIAGAVPDAFTLRSAFADEPEAAPETPGPTPVPPVARVPEPVTAPVSVPAPVTVPAPDPDPDPDPGAVATAEDVAAEDRARRGGGAAGIWIALLVTAVRARRRPGRRSDHLCLHERPELLERTHVSQLHGGESARFEQLREGGSIHYPASRPVGAIDVRARRGARRRRRREHRVSETLEQR